MNSSKQIKLGAMLSYFTIAFNIVAGLIYTPWMITQIGQSNYGLYTLATSLITMFLVDFGMSAAVTRFVAKYNAEKDQEKVNNFLGCWKINERNIILVAINLRCFCMGFWQILCSYSFCHNSCLVH